MERRKYTCCFTGHRPEKLPWGGNEQDPRCVRLKEKLREVLGAAYEDGVRYFICGMARGCDFYFAEAVLALRAEHPEVELEAAVPCPEQAARWPAEDQARWRGLLEACNRETLVQTFYSRGCMLRRNRYMVDHSALVIAVYDGGSGGTRQTLEYALRKRMPLVDIDPRRL